MKYNFLSVVITMSILVLFVSIFTIGDLCAAEKDREIIISVKQGDHYYHTMKWLNLIPIKNSPQMAFWLEDTSGKYISTIYVTSRSALSKWRGGKNIRRPSALPIWSHKRGVKSSDGYYMPAKDNQLPDAVTGATPNESFSKVWKMPEDVKSGTYVLRAEFNHSYDYNDNYAKDDIEGDVSGEPSILWEVEIEFGDEESKVLMQPVGHGHRTGENGEIYRELDSLSTAISIIESIEVWYTSGK
ncbi:MAG: hypothetical protein KAX49_08065 [Halanaerobiales bacterium]|nr:hypothetical protein [Halanaerobiales bacterium]